MKGTNLKKLLSLTLAATAMTALFPIAASAAWKPLSNNNWAYTEGKKLVTGWKKINNSWYFFNPNGTMKTGWTPSGNTWYYLQPSGIMKTGWIPYGDKWYYANSSGAIQTGLLQLGEKVYYLDATGAMQTGSVKIGDQTYTFDATTGEKINTPSTNAVDTTASTSTDTNNGIIFVSNSNSSSNSDNDSSSSSSSKSSHHHSTSDSYKDLYGDWTVGKNIPSSIPSSLGSLASTFVGKTFTVEKNKITAGILAVDNLKVKENTLSSSAFKDKYNETLSNIGIPGNRVKVINVSDTQHAGKSIDVLVGDNGKVYALLKGSLFELEKN